MTRLGRTKIAAVRALSTATRELAICAPGVRRSWISSPDGSTTAITTRLPCYSANAWAANITASAPRSSMILRVRMCSMSGSFRGERRRPDGCVGRDEERRAVAAAEGEVDGARQMDLAELVARRREDLHAA